ncbi:alpha/beta fold hydrolase [Flavobacterium piscis]|uniref:Alpha/beta hydrolase n=1 Tax=Flavobacterium piscis TaxID=1114874 RepID=A0ABU1Y7J5_9FLAO|nr:alpha/beta fold hydrolase [Flavobacterium piscis]MDR7210118.1 putative alpha/beta hydrolase [Flavobacterium piscis]
MKTIEIKTDKEHTITANVYEAEQSGAVLIISSATGVKQAFYRKFAEFVSANGVSVITFDYLGIGLSLKQPIKQLQNDASDWGKVDLEAIIKYATEHYPNSKLTLLGHSIGGQLIGLAKSSSEVQKIILVSAQSGYWKFWKNSGKFKMWVNWHILFPLLINTFGYLPSKKVSGMENLPKNVAKQWSKWGRTPNYLFDDISGQELFFKTISVKILAISIENDAFAPKEAVDWLAYKYENSEIKRVHLMSKDYATKEIGHFGIFREKFANDLWKLFLNEVEK